MRRSFNKSEKQILFLLADGKCQLCGEPLGRGWHADHIVPYSKGGLTEVRNGQALCQKCNLTKSNKMIHLYNDPKLKLRSWQKECHNKIQTAIDDGSRQSFLAVAGVGSGKTMMAAYIAAKNMISGRFNNVIIISPSDNIKYNWAMKFMNLHGAKIDYKYTFNYSWKADFNGISITYQSLKQKNAEFISPNVDHNTLIIVDEVHHCGDEQKWGEGLETIAQNAGFILLLSGTPTRSDNSRIPFCEYEPHHIGDKLWRLKCDYIYKYSESVNDGYCAPVRFHRRGSTILTDEGEMILRNDIPISSSVYNGMLRVSPNNKDCWVYKTFIDAKEKLNEINDTQNQNNAGLVVCNEIKDAVNLHAMLTKEYGDDFAVLVTSDDKSSSEKIERFKNGVQPWIISVKMVSEGVDIPRIRVILYASNYTTPLFFMQVMGRGVRNDANRTHVEGYPDFCHMYIPDLAALNEIAENIENDIVHVVEEIEERAKKERESYSTTKLVDLNRVLSSTSDHNGDIVMGNHFDPNEEHHMQMVAKRMNTSLEFAMKFYAEIKKMGISDNSGTQQIKHPTQKKDDLRKQIHSAVNKMAYSFDIAHQEIHFKANSIIGKRTDEQTISELEKKLHIINSWIKDLEERNEAV